MPPKRQYLRRVRAVTAAGGPEESPGAAPTPPGEPDLVLLIHAEDMAEAERYRSLLEGHGIPVAIEGDGPGGPRLAARGVPVLVAENLADAAADVIAELEFIRPEGRPVDEEDIFDGEETDDLEGVPAEDLDDLDEGDDLDEDLDDDLDEDLDDDLDEDWDDEDDWDDDEDEDDDEDWDEDLD
ncbi:MAG: DUF2007 domain-containing protein [Phycisphaerae bacterium]